MAGSQAAAGMAGRAPVGFQEGELRSPSRQARRGTGIGSRPWRGQGGDRGTSWRGAGAGRARGGRGALLGAGARGRWPLAASCGWARAGPRPSWQLGAGRLRAKLPTAFLGLRFQAASAPGGGGLRCLGDWGFVWGRGGDGRVGLGPGGRDPLSPGSSGGLGTGPVWCVCARGGRCTEARGHGSADPPCPSTCGRALPSLGL